MIPKADGTGYEELTAEKLSDMVTYSNTTLANALENFEEDLTALGEKQDHSKILDKLSALNFSENKIIYSVDSDTLTTFSATETGKKILVASDFENFRGIIQAPTAETFLWDETEKVVWEKVGSPTISATNAKFSKALQCSAGNYAQSKETITFGGQSFTIDIWDYVSSSIAQNGTILSFSQSGNNGLIKLDKIQRNASDGSAYLKIYNSSGSQIVNDSVFDRCNTYDLNKKIHIEICYNGSTVYLFIDGVRKFSANCTIERLARTINLGSSAFIGSISEFRILDGVCLHTGNFTTPTTPYELTDKTISLLHFDKSY